jgi:uncharacterized MAPEG superfamily protein
MGSPGAPELFWLVATILLTGILWIPYIVERAQQLGRPTLDWFPSPDPPPRALWAGRAVRAHANAVENLVLFAPLVLTLHGIGITTGGIEACRIYFFARAAHAIATIFGFPIPIRTIAFLTGYACVLTLAMLTLKSL